jgi:hypothetical protein
LKSLQAALAHSAILSTVLEKLEGLVEFETN